ncbi:MAG: hypothetical protein V3V30_07495 [Parvularculaceae bacterium]
MFWLITHQWLLLALAFLLGLFIGWWIWHRRRTEITHSDSYRSVAPSGALDTHASGGGGVAAGAAAIGAASMDIGTKPKLYDSPTNGPANDLKKIKGIGPNYEKLLNEIGIWYYDQIEHWTADEIKWLDNKLEFPGRIVRDDWQGQAKVLDAGGKTEFADRYDKGETPSSYKEGDDS